MGVRDKQPVYVVVVLRFVRGHADAAAVLRVVLTEGHALYVALVRHRYYHILARD